jgi:acyl-coenzyme A synthetase/AMP-(fatty) acid ligase
VLSLARTSTAYGLGSGLFFPLAAGASVLLFPAQPKSDSLYATIAAASPTVLLATPSIYGQLVHDAGDRERPLAGLRAAVAGAEAMPDQLIPRIRAILGTEVTVGYGLTEIFQFALGGRTDDPGIRAAVCGRPLPGVEARVVDDEGRPVGTDEIGTLQLRCPSLASRYDRDALGGVLADAEWFTTGDRFMVDSAGNYSHCGRVDDLFKVGGKWVSPVEVERALIAHEAVWDCAVIGAPDEHGLTKPLAFVVTNVGHSGDERLVDELREYVKQVLAPYKYPRWIEFVDALPRGPGGKVLRYRLRPARRRRPAETGGDAP